MDILLQAAESRYPFVTEETKGKSTNVFIRNEQLKVLQGAFVLGAKSDAAKEYWSTRVKVPKPEKIEIRECLDTPQILLLDEEDVSNFCTYLMMQVSSYRRKRDRHKKDSYAYELYNTFLNNLQQELMKYTKELINFPPTEPIK